MNMKLSIHPKAVKLFALALALDVMMPRGSRRAMVSTLLDREILKARRACGGR